MHAHCKSVRSDQNYWEQVEDYVAQHVNVRFTHGICPTCYDKVIAEWEVGDGSTKRDGV